MKTVLVSSDEPHHLALASRLSESGLLAGWAVEPQAALINRLWTARRYRSWFWFSYHAMRRRILGLSRYRLRFFLGGVEASRTLERRVVDWVNSEALIEYVQSRRPEIVVIIGVSILSKTTIDSVGVPIVNVHGGYLPYYKGNHCFFFALYDGRMDRIGSTIHFVDEGIDTGDIIAIAGADISRADTPETLYCKCEDSAFDRLIEILATTKQPSSIDRRPQSATGRAIRMQDRTLWHDLCFYWNRAIARLHRRKLP